MFTDPIKNLRAFGLREDNVVADLGAGTGFYSVAAGHIVGRGKVYAIDIEPEMINVTQKKRQIGILKAMGATNKFIIGIYLIETLIYSVLSYLLGFLIFISIHLYYADHPTPLLIGDFRTVIDVQKIWISAITLSLAAFGGSFIPAYMAAKTKIVDVMRGVV